MKRRKRHRSINGFPTRLTEEVYLFFWSDWYRKEECREYFYLKGKTKADAFFQDDMEKYEELLRKPELTTAEKHQISQIRKRLETEKQTRAGAISKAINYLEKNGYLTRRYMKKNDRNGDCWRANIKPFLDYYVNLPCGGSEKVKIRHLLKLKLDGQNEKVNEALTHEQERYRSFMKFISDIFEYEALRKYIEPSNVAHTVAEVLVAIYQTYENFDAYNQKIINRIHELTVNKKPDLPYRVFRNSTAETFTKTLENMTEEIKEHYKKQGVPFRTNYNLSEIAVVYLSGIMLHDEYREQVSVLLPRTEPLQKETRDFNSFILAEYPPKDTTTPFSGIAKFVQNLKRHRVS